MQFFVGTSGYAYPKWKGTFYPRAIKAGEMLKYYGEHFGAVEINNSFYRLPETKTLTAWAGEVPAAFRFAIKAPQTITHRKRLKDAEAAADELLRTIAVLRRKCGPVLFQLPPNMKKDLPRLEAFLKMLKRHVPSAFEFRHASWFDDEVVDCLRSHRSALCLADAEELPAQKLVATADWGYVRLRRENYTPRQLDRWAERIAEQSWKRVYVFFKHEDTGTGPRFARRFLKACDDRLWQRA